MTMTQVSVSDDLIILVSLIIRYYNISIVTKAGIYMAYRLAVIPEIDAKITGTCSFRQKTKLLPPKQVARFFDIVIDGESESVQGTWAAMPSYIEAQSTRVY